MKGPSFLHPGSAGRFEIEDIVPEWQSDWNEAERWHWNVEIEIGLLEPSRTETVELWLPMEEMRQWYFK